MLDLIINRKAPRRDGLLAMVAGQIVAASTARLPRLVRNDGEPVKLRVAEPSQSGANFDPVDLSGYTVRIGIGTPDQTPTAGTFKLQVGADVTPDLSYDATAVEVETELNLLPDIFAQGGVTVEKIATGAYKVTWVEEGVEGSIPATASRSSVVRIYPLPLVTSYTGGGPTNLDGATTFSAALNSLFWVVINGVWSAWRLESGTAATDVDAGIIRPTDYNASTNAVNLVRVAGL